MSAMDHAPTDTTNLPPPIAGLDATNLPPATGLANITNPNVDKTVMFLFTVDLRLHDNPGLCEAIKQASNLIPVYCFDPRDVPNHVPYPWDHTRFLFAAIADLQISLQTKRTDLIIRVGKPEEILPELCTAYSVSSVFVLKKAKNHGRQKKLRTALSDAGVMMEAIPGNAMYEEKDLPFAVVSMPAFRGSFLWRVRNAVIRSPLPVPRSLPPLPEHFSLPHGDIPTFADLNLHGTYIVPSVHLPLYDMTGGETEALRRLSAYVDALSRFDNNGYERDRDFSVEIFNWLHIGCISPRRIVRDLRSVRSLKDVKDLTTFTTLIRSWEYVHTRAECSQRLVKTSQSVPSVSGRVGLRMGPYRAFERS